MTVNGTPVPHPAVRLRCPDCGHRWDVARERPGIWWGKQITPEKIAPMCWCPKCSATPPTVVED